MSTHNICFHGEIKKSQYFSVEKIAVFGATQIVQIIIKFIFALLQFE